MDECKYNVMDVDICTTLKIVIAELNYPKFKGGILIECINTYSLVAAGKMHSSLPGTLTVEFRRWVN